MHLTRLTVSGLKAQNREIDLAPLSILEGPTGAGKTTLLQAIAVAIFGIDPRIGRSLDALRPLLPSSDVRISLADDTGFSVTRRMVKNAKQALSCLTSVYPPKGERTNTDAANRVEREWGQLTVFLDVAELLNQSPAKRRAFIANLASAAGLAATPEQLTALVDGTLTGLPDEECELTRRFFRALLPCFLGVDLQSGVSTALTQLSLQITETNAVRTAAIKAQEAFRTELQSSPDASSSLADLQEQLAACIEESNAIHAELGAAEQQQRRRTSDQATLQSTRRELQRWGTEPEPLPPIHDTLTALANADEAVSTVMAKLTVAEGDVAVRTQRVRALEEAFTNEQRALGLLAEKERQCAVLDEPCELANQAGCRYGKLLALFHSAQAERSVQEERVVTARASLDTAIAQREQATHLVTVLTDGLSDLTAHAQSLRQVVDQHNATMETRRQDARERDAAVKALASQITGLEDAIAEPVPDIELLQARRTSVEGQIASLDHQLRDVGHREGIQIAYHEAEVRAAQAETDLQCLTRLKDVLGPSGLQGTITKQLLQPLEQAANAAFLSHLPYGWRLVFVTRDEKGSDILDFALQKGGTIIRWDALSTGEELTASVALVMGLMALVKPPLRVLLVDNLSLIDRANRLPFVHACREMVLAGSLDSVVIASNEPLGVDGDGVSTITLTGGAGA